MRSVPPLPNISLLFNAQAFCLVQRLQVKTSEDSIRVLFAKSRPFQRNSIEKLSYLFFFQF